MTGVVLRITPEGLGAAELSVGARLYPGGDRGDVWDGSRTGDGSWLLHSFGEGSQATHSGHLQHLVWHSQTVGLLRVPFALTPGF